MKIAVVYQYYQGHSAPGHSLIYEYTQHLAEQGHQVTVISGETGYMRPDQPRRPWYKRLLCIEHDGPVKVIRTYTYSELHRSYLGRLISFISFSLTAPIGLLRADKPDVLLASSPPIFPMFSIWLVCKLRRIPMVFEVRDLWPESAVQMGILRNRVLIAVMSWMERVLYDHCDLVVALTQGIHDDIERRGWSAKKLKVITCGVDLQMLFPDLCARQKVRLEHGWGERNVVLYLGAMGQANNLDLILDAACRCEDDSVLFVLVGDGMQRLHLEARVQAESLANVVILPSVPKAMARAYINAADICLVTLLDIPLFQGAIPTKLLDYMACECPVLCGISGEAAEIVSVSGAGIVFAPSADRLLAAMMELLADPERRRVMGERGGRYVRAYFNAQVNRARMEATLAEVASSVPSR
ncbi:glycosyltransferase family 4 protein [Pseudomonas chengduensis]|nr:glycosyltransferase family 4 protein [Pseudomonas chengduensis]MDH1560804.1 glycosyltransferase family 4 protein [Pseudomonas chengduensis]